MITLTAKIELSGAYSNLLSEASPSLVDNAEDTEVNSFIIGESRLGEGAVFGGGSSGAITEIVINQRNLISLESSIFDRSDIKFPSWGIISNGGRLEFNDPFGDVKVLAEQNLLTSNQKVSIYINETLSQKNEQIGDFFTTVWDYDVNNKVASVGLRDSLEEMQNINLGEINRADWTNSSKYFTAAEIYFVLNENTPNHLKLLTVAQLDSFTQNLLENTYVRAFIIYSGTLWSAWTKLCELCQLQIYIDKNGNRVCKYNGGA